MRLRKTLSESMIAFRKIDKIVSKAFLYYSSTCGFIFGWIVMGILFLSIGDAIPSLFVVLLRIFYFLISFLLGLKLMIFIINLFQKKNFLTKK